MRSFMKPFCRIPRIVERDERGAGGRGCNLPYLVFYNVLPYGRSNSFIIRVDEIQ